MFTAASLKQRYFPLALYSAFCYEKVLNLLHRHQTRYGPCSFLFSQIIHVKLGL